jgi:hypothetical protein
VPGDSFSTSIDVTRSGSPVGNPYIVVQAVFSPTAASMISAPRLTAATPSALGTAVHASVVPDPGISAQSLRQVHQLVTARRPHFGEIGCRGKMVKVDVDEVIVDAEPRRRFFREADVLVLAVGHKGVLDTATPPAVNFNFSMGDLSAWAGRAELRYAWPAGSRIIINHTDPQASSRLVVYKQSSGSLTELARKDGGGSIAIDKADELGKSSVALLFWVSNARASRPYTELTPMSIQVSAVPGSSQASFPDGTYDFRTGTVKGCADYSMGGWIMTAANGVLSLKYGSNVANVGVSGSGTALPNPAGGYSWNPKWRYSYTAPDSQTENVTASGTFDGFRLQGTLVKGSCRVDFTDVIVTLVKR